MADGNGNGYVTWRALTALVGTVAGMIITIGWIAWQVHASQPHHGAIERPEFERSVEGIEQDLDGIEADLDRLEEKIDSLISR